MKLRRMIESMAHRGPDASGIWTGGSVGLGHTMLWGTPQAPHEQLPLTKPLSDLTITADARIDNRADLIEILGLGGDCPAMIPDSELILCAYEKWGQTVQPTSSAILLSRFGMAESKLFCCPRSFRD